MKPEPSGRGLDRDYAVVSLAAELFSHEGSYKSAQIRAAARAADDHVGLDAVFVHGRLRLKADDRLMEEHLI